MSIFKKRAKISTDVFAADLAVAFKKMRAKNIETLRMFLPEMIEKMSKDEVMKLNWELSIFNMFNIVYCCRLLISDKMTCDEVLDIFHNIVYMGFYNIEPILAVAFQDESKIKYKTYFEAMRTSNPIWELCKEVWKNILGVPCKYAIETNALSVYFEGNQRFTMAYFKDMMKLGEIADKWKIKKDLIKSFERLGGSQTKRHDFPEIGGTPSKAKSASLQEAYAGVIFSQNYSKSLG